MSESTSLALRAFTSSNPNLAHRDIFERQSGYRPDLGSCGIATTCSSACGNDFKTCEANTALALFCYNPSEGQTCCNNGDGQACDAGYYCARDGSSTTWCCKNKYNLAQCASIYQLSTLVTGSPSSSTKSSTASSPTTLQPQTIASSDTTSVSTSTSTTRHNVSASRSTIGYLNSTITYISRPPDYTGAAASRGVSLMRVVLLGLLLCAPLAV